MDVKPTFPLSVIQPGAYSIVDATQMTAADRPQDIELLVVIGDALGGVPNVPMLVYGESSLRSVLRGGKAYDSARVAMAAGASVIAVVRAGASITQSSLALQNASAATVCTLTSLGFGSFANAIKATVSGTNKVTITYTEALNGVTYTETYQVPAATATADVGDVLAKMVNGLIPGVPKSGLVTATNGAAQGPLATLAQTALSGGSDGSALDAGAWTTALTAIETLDCDIVHPATDDATVHAQVTAHCIAMSATAARKERVQIAGGALGETPTQFEARCKVAGVAHRRTQLCYPGISLYDEAGRVTAYSPVITAAHKAGRTVALPDVATSLTHQRVDVLGLERQLSTIPGGDVDTLLRAGGCLFNVADGGGYWIVDDLVTEQVEPAFRDLIKVRSADAVAKRLRRVLEARYVGTKGINGSTGRMTETAREELAAMRGEELIRDFQSANVLVTQDPANPRQYAVIAPVLLVDTVKFLNITVALQAVPATRAAAA